MTNLKESLEKELQYGITCDGKQSMFSKYIQEWQDNYIKELEEHMKADQNYFDSPDERGYRYAISRMLKFLKGETIEAKQE